MPNHTLSHAPIDYSAYSVDELESIYATINMGEDKGRDNLEIMRSCASEMERRSNIITGRG